MNQHTLCREVRALGLVIRWDSDWQEYTVNYPNAKKGEGYHTSDREDALDTARSMARAAAGLGIHLIPVGV